MVATRSEGSTGKARAALASILRRPRTGPGEDPAAPDAHPTLAAAARAAGWPSTRANTAFLADLDALLSRRPRGVVAVLADDAGGGVQGVIRRAYPGARVHEFDPALGPSERHARLAARGRFDVVLWEPSPTLPTVKLVEELLFHLRKGGALLLRYRRPPGGSGGDDAYAEPRKLAAALLDRLGQSGNDAKMLSRAVERVVAGRLHVVVGNRMVALAKVREEEANLFLSQRGGQSGRVLTQLPAVEFTSRCDLREGKDSRTQGMYESYDVPAMSLREYRRVTCVPRQIAVHRNVLLPDTYRHNAAARLKNRFTREIAPRFARLPDRWSDARPLQGTYFYLDSEWPAHFGHVMTEQLSRLWALQAAREAHPDLKVLLSRRPGEPDLTPFELPIFAAAGIAEQEIVLFDSPVRVERLVAATPMFSAPRYVHPDLAEVWERTGDALCAAAADRRYPERIFCSRREKRRRCHNSDEVEARFAAAGFEVVFPEDFPIAEQARMSREADVVAGFAGSGLLSLMFAPSPKQVIVLAPSSYTARNEYMICSVLGHRMDVVWSESDIPQPVGGWDSRAVRSGFTFDFAQEGVRLDRILAEL